MPLPLGEDMEYLPESLKNMLDKNVEIAYKFPMGAQGGGIGFPGTKGKCIAVDLFAITLMTTEGHKVIRHDEIQYYGLEGTVAAPQGLVLPTFSRG